MSHSDKTEGLIAGTGCDAVLITDPYNMRYLSGFSGGEGMLFLAGDCRVLITDSRYTEQAGRESDFTVLMESAKKRRSEILSELVAKSGAGSIGYEDLHMRCAEFASLQEKLNDALCGSRDVLPVWKPVGDAVNSLRAVKSAEEIACIEKAEAIGDAAFGELLGWIGPGMTELEAAALLEYLMKKNGASGFSFDTIMASGPNSSMPHAVPTDRSFAYGDLITMDFGCIYKGYCSDMTRTIAVGDPGAKKKQVYDTVLEAQCAALKYLRPGVKASDADRIARDVIEKAGYGPYFGHALGHSVGLYIHEKPSLSPSDDTILEAGMTVTVEPGIYLPGEFGVRIEDLVVITADGCRNLTHSSKELITVA